MTNTATKGKKKQAWKARTIQDWYFNICEQYVRAGPNLVAKTGGQNIAWSCAKKKKKIHHPFSYKGCWTESIAKTPGNLFGDSG